MKTNIAIAILFVQVLSQGAVAQGMQKMLQSGTQKTKVEATSMSLLAEKTTYDSSLPALSKTDSIALGFVKNARFKVSLLSYLQGLHSEVVACTNNGDFYFYTKSQKKFLGKPEEESPNYRPYRLHAISTAHGNQRKVRVVSRNPYYGEQTLGMIWDESFVHYYITRTEINDQGCLISRIYRSFKDTNDHVHEEMLDLKGDSNTSDFHPAIYGKMLVFASDRMGRGGSDLFFSEWLDGKWSVPQSLGPLVNTSGDEGFPNFSASGSLYFTSDNLPGFGKRDIHITEFKENQWTSPLNAGAAINTREDDFGLVWNRQGHTGYFASNRNQGTDNDIYTFERYPEFGCKVVDSTGQCPIVEASISIHVDGNDETFSVDARGEFYKYLNPQLCYRFDIRAKGYHPKAINVAPSQIKQGADHWREVSLDPEAGYVFEVQIADTLGKAINGATILLLEKRSGSLIDSITLPGSTYAKELRRDIDYMFIVRRKYHASAFVELTANEFCGKVTDRRQIIMRPSGQILLVGVVSDSMGNQIPGKSKIDLLDRTTHKTIRSLETDSTGAFAIWIDASDKDRFSLFATHTGRMVEHYHVCTNDDQFFTFTLDAEHLGLQLPVMRLFYGVGRTQVEGAQMECLDDIYYFMLRNPEIHMELRTYTDTSGSETVNDDISRKRSAAILTELVLRPGINPDRITRKDYGERLASKSGGDPAEDRRTEVYFWRPNIEAKLDPSVR